jgi:RNA polymerase sigma-70 factor, ECF subfamily
MAFDGFPMDLRSDYRGEVCVESAVHGVMQRAITLEERITRIFELLRDPIFFYLMGILHNAAEAEDLTQEAFLKLYRAFHRRQHIENVRFWLFRAAHNLACDQLKREQHFERADDHTWEAIQQQLHDPSLNPEQRVLQMERFERLHGALAWLSPQELKCMHLRAEGFRYREIGEILGIGTKTAAEFLRRAMSKLMRENNG